MCGRMTSTSDSDKLAEYFDVDETTESAATMQPSYNVAPTDQILVVAEHHGKRQLGTMKWGLVPFYDKNGSGGAQRINARADTIQESNAYRRILERRRCIIPADGFFEWQDKQPWYFTSRTGLPLAFAGLWDVWRDPGRRHDSAARLVTCTIVTTEATPDVSPVHNRMPLTLRRDDWDTWLRVEDTDLDEVRLLLEKPLVEELVGVPVSNRVGNVKNNDPENIQPIRIEATQRRPE